MLILLSKSYVKGYTRKDGTVVAPYTRRDNARPAPKTEAGLYDTSGLTRQQERELIQGEAERLASMLREDGFETMVHHSGSAAGPSSYLTIVDPDTEVYMSNVRVSGHAKGTFNSQFVWNVAGDKDFARVIDKMRQARAKAREKPGYVSKQAREDQAQQARQDKRKQALELIERRSKGEKLTSKQRRLIQWYEYEVAAGRMAKAHVDARDWQPPTPAQAAAGNYKKRRVYWKGFEISIENDVGSVRSGVDQSGKSWSVKMKNPYGYLRRTLGADGDQFDCYLGPDLNAEFVYVITTMTPGRWNEPDEQKAMIGFPSEEAARQAFREHYDDPRFMGAVKAMPVAEFVQKVKATRNNPNMIKSIILFLKGGAVGAPGLHKQVITDKNGRRVAHWVRAPRATYKNPAQLAFDFENLYENIETRPDTTDTQTGAGRAAVKDLAQRILGFRVGREPAVSILGSRFCRDFIEQGSVTLVGQRIKTPGDLAALAQIYRDPRFETARVFYVKGDEIVGETAYSSRLPGSVNFSGSFGKQILEDIEAFGADGYYLVHNHPSGRANASEADIVLTKSIADNVPGFRSHVIIDHKEYGVIDEDGRTHVVEDERLSGINFHDQPELDHDMLGIRLTQPADVAIYAKAMQSRGELERPVLVMTQGQYAEVSLLMSMPVDAIPGYGDRKGVTKAKGWIRSIGRKIGAGSHIFALVSDHDASKYEKQLAQLIREGIVTDVVSSSGKSMRMTGVHPMSGGSLWSTNKPAPRILVGQKLQKSLAEDHGQQLDFGTP